MICSNCIRLHHRSFVLLTGLSFLYIFYLNYTASRIATKIKYIDSVIFNGTTTKFSTSLPALQYLVRRNADLKPQNKTDKINFFREVVYGMRNLPSEVVVAEYPSPSLAYNGSCAVFPSILDIQFVNSYWQKAQTSQGAFFIYGAYYDNRRQIIPHLKGSTVRILGVMEHYIDSNATKDYCQFWFENEDKPAITQIAEQKYVWRKRWGTSRKYHSYLLSCILPPSHQHKIPISVSLVAEPCENASNIMRVQYEKSPSRKGFAICVKGLRLPKRDISLRTIEWIELYRLIGVDKIFFYQYDPIHPNMSKVMEYYKSTGFVDVTPYSLPGYLPDEPLLRQFYLSGFFRKMEIRRTELITYNDCLYRNLYNYEYVTVIDIDEVIMPLNKVATLRELVNIVKKQNPEDFNSFGAICFRNVYFFDYWMKDIPWLPNLPLHMYHLRHILRANNHSRLGLAAKCIHSVEKILTLHNHYPIEFLNKRYRSINLEPSEAQMQHYKPECPSAIVNCSQTIGSNPVLDLTIWKYKTSLVEAVAMVMKTLGFVVNLENDSL